ncbi:MAG: nucleoside kinase [Chloroflexi bacterium]|nr:nucleoside kinase [Chloroflexota bacterium]
MPHPEIHPAQPRQTALVAFQDGRLFEGPIGLPLKAFVEAAYPASPEPIAAALMNGELVELTHPVSGDTSVQVLDTTTTDGMRIYQRSLLFVLVVAANELFPEARIIVDHSVTLGGFFCQVKGRALFNAEELHDLEARMQEIVARDEPILREEMPVAQAQAIFEAMGYDDKVRLLRFREEPTIAVYRLRGVYDYFYGYMMPSTGALSGFWLELYPPGFILRVPQMGFPLPLHSHHEYPKLMGVFREYGEWLSILGIEDIGSLNEAVENGRIRQAVLVSEALHEKQIARIADEIAHRRPRVRVVLVAGPSSSGKTTFVRRLAVQLLVNEVRPVALGLDDYFVDRDKTPRDANGEYDFESLEALNLALFSEHIRRLLAGERVTVPRFDFHQGKGLPDREVTLTEDAILLVEGIHGLNPRLLTEIPAEAIYRIYVSALTQLNIDHHNRIPTTDVRLLRRIVRDSQFRGYSAQETIQRWASVRRGEERNIFPYQENADVMFNSALAYELAVLKPYVEPLLLTVPPDVPEWLEARRLLAFLRWVRPCGADCVPDNSLLREFIGGSILEEFTF